MALAFNIANAAAKAALDALTARLNGGSLKIYAGTITTDSDTAIGAQTLLATLPLNATAFGAATDANPGAIATANAITGDTTADATGTASFYRALNSGGTCQCQGTVGTSGCDLNLNSVAIQANADVEVSSWTITLPEQ